MLGIKKFFKGLGLVPKTSSEANAKGELEVLDGDGKLRYHNGTSVSPVVTEAHSATLTNKTIDGDDNTIQDLNLTSLKPDLPNADKVIRRDASGVIVSGNTLPNSSTIITIDAVQTLTNKTIDGDDNIVQDLALTALKADLSNVDKVIRRDASGNVISGNILPNTSDLVTVDSTQTLTNKTIDGDDNTIQDIALTSLKTDLSNTNKVIRRDASGNVISGNALPNSSDIVTIDASQVITNKDVDGGTASNSNRITLPKNTTVNLNALTRKQGTVMYDTTVNKVLYDDGSTLHELGSGGGGDAPVNFSVLNNQATPVPTLLTVAQDKGFTLDYSVLRKWRDAQGDVNNTLRDEIAGIVKFDSSVYAISIQSDGKILVGGNFKNYASTFNRNRLVRLNSDGTLDTAFTANSSDGDKFNSSIQSIAIQSDGKILVGGDFTNYAGTNNRNRLVRLNSDGTLDTTFTANASDGNKFNNPIQSIAIQSDGKILFGGDFINYANNMSLNFLVSLNSDGTLDTAFTNNSSVGRKFNDTVFTIAIQSDGKILVGGGFTNYAGTTDRNRLIRLNSDGTLDTTFTANASDGAKFNSSIQSIAIQSDGKILVGGNFTNYAGTNNRNRLVRLNSDGTLDTTFTANASDGAKFNNNIQSIAIQSDGKILVGGGFASLYGFFVVFDNNAVAGAQKTGRLHGFFNSTLTQSAEAYTAIGENIITFSLVNGIINYTTTNHFATAQQEISYTANVRLKLF
jgi:uncharacterized delta-60 repeat protein